MRPDDADGFREAWAILERLWDGHRRAGPDARPRTRCTAASTTSGRSSRPCATSTSPAPPGWAGWSSATPRRGTRWTCRGTRRPAGTASRGTARRGPSLDEVLAVRARTPGDGPRGHGRRSPTSSSPPTVTRTEPGWPRMEDFPVKECLRIVLNEEWEHRLYAERDLDRTGEGELIMDIVLIAGLWLDGSAWDDVVPALASLGHRAVPVTLPGQGDGVRGGHARRPGGGGGRRRRRGVRDGPWWWGTPRPAPWRGSPPTRDRRTWPRSPSSAASRPPTASATPTSSTSTDGVMPFPGWGPFEGADSADLDEDAKRRIEAAAIPVPEGGGQGRGASGRRATVRRPGRARLPRVQPRPGPGVDRRR